LKKRLSSDFPVLSKLGIADIPREWLNLELIKKPTQYIEYVVVHELAHIIEKNHRTVSRLSWTRHYPIEGL